MSRSYWLSIFALVGWLIGGDLPQAQQPKGPTFEGQPMATGEQQNTSANSDDRIQDQQAEPEKIVPALKSIEDAIHDLKPKNDEAKDKRDEDRAKDDLKAQEDMAAWAKWMLWATAASVAVSLVGLGMIWRSLQLAREAIHADKRPWLDFSVKVASDFERNDTANHAPGLGVDLTLHIQNYGASPALSVMPVIEEIRAKEGHYVNDFFLVERRNQLKQDYATTVDRPRDSIFPGQQRKIGIRLLVSQQAIDEAIPEARMDGRPPNYSTYDVYVIAIFYRSHTSKLVHETSSTFVVFHKMDGGFGTLSFKKDSHFVPIPKRDIRIVDFSQKRAY
jgi:hypothetical protein